MGMSLTCLHYGPLYERLLDLISNLVDFSSRKSDENGQVPILRALGSGKMLIERSSSLKRVKSDQDAPVRMTRIDSHEFILQEMAPEQTLPQPSSPKDEAAIKLQKVYKSFRTRRQLADCAVLVEQRWWKLLDFALLKQSSVSFFDHERPETAVHRWYRARMRAAKVGKGVSKDAKAQKLALQHWLEAIDPRHRYGHNLHFYYLNWLLCQSKQPFFYWLDVGEGKEVNLPQCSRSKLQQQCIKYLGPKERETYEVILEDGKLIYKQSGQLLDTSGGCQDLKWIFVLSTSKILYVGQKKKGRFQHSSFLAGGATSSAGRLVVENGVLKAVWPHSGHYRPTEENFLKFMSFLRDNNVDLSDVKRSPTEDDEVSLARPSSSSRLRRMSSRQRSSKNLKPAVPDNVGDGKPVEMLQHHSYDGEDDYLCMESEGSLAMSDGPRECYSTEPQPLADGINALDIKQIFMGSEGETEEDSDDNAACIIAADIRVLPDAPDEVSRCSFAPETSKEGHDAAEDLLSSSIYIFQKKNLFEEDLHEGTEQHLPKDLLLQRIDSIHRTKSVQLAKQWTSGVGPRIGCVRDYPSHIQFQALEQVNLSPRSVRTPPSACSTPPTTASSTPRSMGTSLLNHETIDNCFCT